MNRSNINHLEQSFVYRFVFEDSSGSQGEGSAWVWPRCKGNNNRVTSKECMRGNKRERRDEERSEITIGI